MKIIRNLPGRAALASDLTVIRKFEDLFIRRQAAPRSAPTSQAGGTKTKRTRQASDSASTTLADAK